MAKVIIFDAQAHEHSPEQKTHNYYTISAHWSAKKKHPDA